MKLSRRPALLLGISGLPPCPALWLSPFALEWESSSEVHAEKIARSIFKHAAGVWVVNLPDLPEKGDVSDDLEWHAKEELIAEIKRAPAWRPQDEPHVMLVEAAKFAVSAPDEIDWAVEDVIERGSNGMFAGEPKHGKSIAALDLCLSVATGASWLGFRVPRRMKCGLVSREDYPGMTARRIGQLYRGSDADRRDLENWLWINTKAQTPNFFLEDESSVNKLIREFRKEQVEFACFDVFRRLHMADENDNTQMAQILAVLSRIQQEVGCALALVHHVNREVSHSIFSANPWRQCDPWLAGVGRGHHCGERAGSTMSVGPTGAIRVQVGLCATTQVFSHRRYRQQPEISVDRGT